VRRKGSATQQLSTQAAKTITPSTSSQTAVASGKYTTGAITVAPIPSNYEDVGTETARFVAECYSVDSWNDGYKREDIANKEAACSDEGLVELNEWLNEEHKKFSEN
jgi:hypothetical protein